MVSTADREASRHPADHSTSRAWKSAAYARAVSTFISFLLVCLASGVGFPGVAHAQTGYPLTYVGTGGTDTKPESKCWFAEGSWWCLLLDGADNYIYRYNGHTTWTKQTVPGIVNPFNTGRADCLSVGDTVYLVMSRGANGDVEIHKFVFDGTHYVRPPDWLDPVTLAIGAGTATIARDSTGRLWLTADINGTTQIAVYYTTTDERTWDGPVILEPNATPEFSISAAISFGGDSVGVLWANKIQETFFFRVHWDSDPPAVWQSQETVDSLPDLVDDHVSVKPAPDGRVFAVVKTDRNETGQLNQALYVRSAAGIWGPRIPVNVVGDPVATRPIVNLDPANNRIYVFYTNEAVGTIDYRTCDMDTLEFGEGTTFIAKPGVIFNDVSSTKQVFTPASGLLAIASDQTDENAQTVYFNRKDLVGVDADGDGWSTATDCDDTNALVNPGRQEIVYNGLDDDCDATTRDDDLDQDGFTHTTDCNDTDPTINPGRSEIVYNGKDDDCNPATRDDDLDQDGYSHSSDCDDHDPTISPGHAEVHNNGKDDDCDPGTPDDTIPPGPPASAMGSLTAVGNLALLLHFDEGAGSVTADSYLAGVGATLGSPDIGDPKEPAWTTSGRFGAALGFDDVDDQVRVPSSDALRIAGSFTVEAWVARRFPASDVDVILNKGEDDASPRNYRVSFEADGRVRFFWELKDGTNRDTYSASAVTDTAWHHIACVYDQAAGENRIYIDGQLDVREAKTGTPATTDDEVFIGAGDIYGLDDCSGLIDEVRISSAAHYGAGFTPPYGPFATEQAHLTWTSNTEPDLAGYNVYRAAASGGPYKRINSGLVKSPEFDDATYAAITRYYVVTAVDATGNESAFSAEVEVGPTGPPMSGDADGDGWFVGSDCDDTDPGVSPGEAEAPYNGKDDDCDAATHDDDLDGDGHPVAGDCNDHDPLVIRVPEEVSSFEMATSGNDTALTWASQGATAGAGTVYDVVGGLLSQLAGDGGYARASCLVSHSQQNTVLVAGPNPVPGDGRYYLVQAKNSCGAGTFGKSSEVPDPRDLLDRSPGCP